jgi:apocytochrome f
MKTYSVSEILRLSQRAIARGVVIAVATFALFFASDLAVPQSAAAYPFWAQQTAPETPREATGRIVCANCHLGAKPTEVEVPQSVLPDTVLKQLLRFLTILKSSKF